MEVVGVVDGIVMLLLLFSAVVDTELEDVDADVVDAVASEDLADCATDDDDDAIAAGPRWIPVAVDVSRLLRSVGTTDGIDVGEVSSTTARSVLVDDLDDSAT